MRGVAGGSTARAPPAEMRVALYAPSDSAGPATPRGGRHLLGLVARALEVAGHQAFLPSDFRSDEDAGDRRRQGALERKGARSAVRLVRTYRDLPTTARPEAWLTCGVGHTAPDLIGPAVAEALGIPYLLVGVSYERAAARGAHAGWLTLTGRAIAHAGAVLSLTAEDEEGARPLVAHPARLHRLAPFLDPAPYAATERDTARRALAAALPLDPARPWLLAAGPMVPGPALASWRVLGRALGLIADPPWQLVAVGDGAARALVDEVLAPLGPGRAVLAGARAEQAMPAVYAACDIHVWPAHDETLCRAVLEAQAAGLPVVAGDWPGAGAIVAHGETGIVAPRHDDVAFAGAVVELAANETERRAMGARASARVRERHGLESAAATLDRALDAALAEAAGRAPG